MMKSNLNKQQQKKEEKNEENFCVCKCFGPGGIHS
jgi:hypothetical protein